MEPRRGGAFPNLVFDFDSTLVSRESLDELAGIALRGRPDALARKAEIESITALGMQGAIPFSESLSKRLGLFSASRKEINEVTALLAESITPSVERQKKFFQTYATHIYVLSSGFGEYIRPVVQSLGIPAERVVANSFLFDDKGKVTSVDSQNPLSGDGGKITAVRALKLATPVWVIGDGYTDYEVRSAGAADVFIAFTENVSRENVVERADRRVANMEELLYLLEIPPA